MPQALATEGMTLAIWVAQMTMVTLERLIHCSSNVNELICGSNDVDMDELIFCGKTVCGDVAAAVMRREDWRSGKRDQVSLR